MDTLYIYQHAFSKVGGIQSFNRTFLLALENIKKKENIKCDFFGIYDDSKDIKSNLEGRCFDGNKIKGLLFLLKSIYSYDIFIVSHVNLALIGILIKILNPKAKLIFCTHGVEVWKKLPWFTKRIMNNSKVLTVSSFSKKMLLKYNDKLSNVVVFPNAIKTSIKNISDNPYNTLVDSLKILTVSRLDESEKDKGIDSTIKALSVLKGKLNFSYYIIGKGSDVERLKLLVNSNDLEKNVHFLGYVNDLNSYYKNSDVFIMPSKKEGFGIVYLEAMLYKKPVIACNYGGVTDVVINDETGILVNYDNINEISNAILKLNNKELAEKFGNHGYKRLMNNFTFNHFENNLKKELLTF